MSRRVSIRVQPLPHRARPLDEQELSGVFGGCLESGEKCQQTCDCCFGLICGTIPTTPGYAYYGCRSTF